MFGGHELLRVAREASVLDQRMAILLYGLLDQRQSAHEITRTNRIKTTIPARPNHTSMAQPLYCLSLAFGVCQAMAIVRSGKSFCMCSIAREIRSSIRKRRVL